MPEKGWGILGGALIDDLLRFHEASDRDLMERVLEVAEHWSKATIARHQATSQDKLRVGRPPEVPLSALPTGNLQELQVEACLRKSRALMLLGRGSEAIRMSRRAHQLRPKDSKTIYILGMQLLSQLPVDFKEVEELEEFLGALPASEADNGSASFGWTKKLRERYRQAAESAGNRPIELPKKQ